MRWIITLPVMIDASFFLGYSLPFGNICEVYPPKIKDIVTNKNYPVYKKLFFTSQEDIEDEFVEQKVSFDKLPTPLEYIFTFAEADE